MSGPRQLLVNDSGKTYEKNFQELDVASGVIDVCIAKHDCYATSDDGTFHVNYVDLHPSRELWNAVLDEAETLTRRTTGKAASKTLTFTADAEAPHLFQLVREACNWQITVLRLAAVPKARRFKYDLNFSHRGHVVRFNDGELEILSDANTNAASGLRERFKKGVRVGIFI